MTLLLPVSDLGLPLDVKILLRSRNMTCDATIKRDATASAAAAAPLLSSVQECSCNVAITRTNSTDRLILLQAAACGYRTRK